jgi:uncharacterized protein (DUF1015 family)
MAIIKPFRAWRPRPDLAEKVAALPYDVMNTEEARRMAAGNPYSFLHVDRAEIDLPEAISPYDDQVYAQARKALETMKHSGVLEQDETPRLYVYQQQRGDHVQTGLVGCTSVEEYWADKIKKHELTRADKEQDRIRHVEACAAHTGPIFLIYRSQPEIRRLLQGIVASPPVFDFTAEDGIGHRVWLADAPVAERLAVAFAGAGDLYIADGHHRAASAAKVARMQGQDGALSGGEADYFLSVLFADDELNILPYNRVVKDLNGLTEETFRQQVQASFQLEKLGLGESLAPSQTHEFGMFLSGSWYRLTLKPEQVPVEVLAALDVSILQYKLLNPILGIGDPRTDQRIDFIGGIRGLQELERRVGQDMQVAFSLYPTQVKELMAIADAGQLMPPKSTWFEPKLRSGLFIHDLF